MKNSEDHLKVLTKINTEKKVSQRLLSRELGMSLGKIILQKKVKILKSDNVRSLEKKVLKIEHEIYPKAIDKFLTNL